MDHSEHDSVEKQNLLKSVWQNTPAKSHMPDAAPLPTPPESAGHQNTGHMTPAAQKAQSALFGGMFDGASSLSAATFGSPGGLSQGVADGFAQGVGNGSLGASHHRTSIDMKKINRAHPDGSDFYRLGAEPSDRTVVSESQVYDNNGGELGTVEPNAIIQVNAGTLFSVPIKGKPTPCTFGFKMSTLGGSYSAWIPLSALQNGGATINHLQEPLHERLQKTIAGHDTHQQGATVKVKASLLPPQWEEHGTLYTFPDQKQGEVENKAKYYFGHGYVNLLSSPPYPDYGAAVSLAADNTDFHPVGPVEQRELYHSLPGQKRPDDRAHDPARKPAGQKLHFAKGYIVDAHGKKTYGWINTLMIPGFPS